MDWKNSEKRIMELASTRPDMACIFQVIETVYPRFTVYRTYVVCYTLNHLTHYPTTELKDDIITIETRDKDLNVKLKELGHEPDENVIYSFLIDKIL